MSIAANDDDDDDELSVDIAGLSLRSHFELQLRAANDLDVSPLLRPPLVFYTHPGTRSTHAVTTTTMIIIVMA